MALCFCLIPHPSPIFACSELVSMPLGVLFIIGSVQSPLGLRQAYLTSQLFSPRNTFVPYESSCTVIVCGWRVELCCLSMNMQGSRNGLI
jgi:hypothetical protein